MMRSNIIAGAGQSHGTALVNLQGGGALNLGRMRTVGEPITAGAVAAAVAAVTTAYEWVANLFGMGPSYTPENGGELVRQFGPTGTNWLGQLWCNSYMDWLKKYRPAIWNGEQDVWTSGASAPTPWRNVYNTYLAAGLPEGALLDANMVPVGLAQAQAAVQTQQAAAPTMSPAQLDALNIMAMQVAGLSGPQVAQQVLATVATLPAAWQNYVTQMAAIWLTSNQPASGGGGGGGADPGGGGGAGQGDKGTMNVLMAVAAAKLFGVF